MNILRWFLTFAAIAVLLAGLFTYKDSLVTARVQQKMHEPFATIEAISVKQTPYQKKIIVSGVSQATQILQLSNEMPGKITKINFSSGKLVSEGQILLEQDYKEESAKLIAAKAKMKFQEKILDRYRTLQQRSEISDEAVDKAIMELRVSESEVAVLESMIDKKTIRSPFTTRVGINNLQIGQYLERNTTITQLIGVDKTQWIDFYVPQVYQELKIGSNVSVSVETPEFHSSNAKIVSIEPMLTDESRHFKYRAEMNNESLSLKHNHLVKVTLPISDERLTVIIPNLAVSKDHLGDYVFVIKQDDEGENRVHRQKVELGDRYGDQVIVNNGLIVGDYIANTGTFKLRPGMKVIVSNPKDNQMVSTL